MDSHLKPESVTFPSAETRFLHGNGSIFVIDSFVNSSTFLKEFEHILILLIAVLVIISAGIILLLYSACYWLIKRPKEKGEKSREHRSSSLVTEVDVMEQEGDVCDDDEEVEVDQCEGPARGNRSRAFSLFVYSGKKNRNSCMDCGLEAGEEALSNYRGNDNKRRNTWCNA